MQTLKQISIQSWQPFEAQPTMLPPSPAAAHPTLSFLLSLQLSSSFMTTQKQQQAKGSQIHLEKDKERGRERAR